MDAQPTVRAVDDQFASEGLVCSILQGEDL